MIDKKFQIIFENIEAQKAFLLLLENKCGICQEKFHVFNKLKEHVRRKHDLHYCELCAENLKVLFLLFSFLKFNNIEDIYLIITVLNAHCQGKAKYFIHYFKIN